MESSTGNKLFKESFLVALVIAATTFCTANSSQVFDGNHCDQVALQIESFMTEPESDILKQAVDEVINKTTSEAVAAAISAYFEAGVVKPVGYSDSTRFANMYHDYVIIPCKQVSEAEQDFENCVQQQPGQLDFEVELFFDKVFSICQMQIAGGEKALRESYKTFKAILAN